jgi:hypothetical protein|tara:strand:+ start:254 stop:514 length:261 start_codon:yes stop_codon:yes gene_type:complete
VKLTKSKLKQIVKEELEKVLDETSMRRKAEHDGWSDYKDDGDRGDHWENYDKEHGTKYLTYYDMGYTNAAEEEEMDRYYSEEEEIE